VFEIVTTRGSTIKGPTGQGLHEHYPIVQLFFGRFLADVHVRPDEGQMRFDWLVPDGLGPVPSAQRIWSELRLLGKLVSMAKQDYGSSALASLLSRTLAILLLGELRMPLSIDDVRFSRSGGLVVINWCVQRSPPGPRLAEVSASEMVDRLASGYGVSRTCQGSQSHESVLGVTQVDGKQLIERD
jgi:hypothetical protein